MGISEFEKSKVLLVVDSVEYVPGSIVSKSILSKKTGMVTLSSFSVDEGIMTKTSPFDTFIQIIDGEAEIIINEISNTLSVGQMIVIPAHARHRIKANSQFKMLSTIIKSGYEDISI